MNNQISTLNFLGKVVSVAAVTVVFSLYFQPVFSVEAVTVAPSVGGINDNGSVSNTGSTTAPSTGGTNNNGSVSNSSSVSVPPTGGTDNNGSVSNTGSTTAPSTGGTNNNGSVSNSGSTAVPTTGGGGNNGAISYNGAGVPVIALLGANPLTITVGTTFVDPGATASDTQSGDLTNTIVVTGGNGSTSSSVDTSAVATVHLVYTATDPSTKISSSVTREVDIVSASNGGGGSGGSSAVIYGAGGAGGGGIGQANVVSSSIVPTASTTITGTLSCPFMTGYVIPGRVNDPAEVSKLQVFLKAYEDDAAVTVTGVLDQPTMSGILAFQQKYLTQVMGPWGATIPSGDAYITTTKKINSIVCHSQLSLTPAEQTIINAYLAQKASNQTGITASTAAVSTSTNTSTTASTSASASTTNGTPNNSVITGNVVSSGAGNFFSNLFAKLLSLFGIK